MAARVTGDEVKEVIDTDLTAADLAPFITAANLTVNEHLDGEGLSDALLKEIERWLAAHFVAIRDPRIKRKQLDDFGYTRHGESGLGLDHTPYGQQVRILDPTGKLANQMQTTRTVAFRVGTGFNDDDD